VTLCRSLSIAGTVTASVALSVIFISLFPLASI
jgi:hypothetical protein